MTTNEIELFKLFLIYEELYTLSAPCGTMMSDCSDIRRVSLSKEGSDFGLAVENAASGGVVITNIQGKTNGVVRRGDRLVEVRKLVIRENVEILPTLNLKFIMTR